MRVDYAAHQSRHVQPLGSRVKLTQCGVTTPSQTFPPNNQDASLAPGNLTYCKPGGPYPQVPDIGVGGWNFPQYGSGGGIDYAGDSASNSQRVIAAGLGVFTIPTFQYLSFPRNWLAQLFHHDGVDILDGTQRGAFGEVVSFAVTHCSPDGYHWVDIAQDGAGSGEKFGFQGFTWRLIA
nr:hypothetical protein [uncultured Rhodopila sp.]